MFYNDPFFHSNEWKYTEELIKHLTELDIIRYGNKFYLMYENCKQDDKDNINLIDDIEERFIDAWMLVSQQEAPAKITKLGEDIEKFLEYALSVRNTKL